MITATEDWRAHPPYPRRSRSRLLQTHPGETMKTRTAARVRRGIRIAKLGTNLNFRIEHPETIDAYLRTASRDEDQP